MARSVFYPWSCILVAAFVALFALGCGGGGGGGGGGGPTVPSVTSTSPANNATGIDPATLQVVVNFSEPMDTTSFNSSGVGKIIELKSGTEKDVSLETNGVWSNGDATLTLSFPSYLVKEGAVYSLTLYAGFAKDKQGTALGQDFTTRFTTLAIAPFVVGTVPAHLATSVDPSGLQVVVNFSEPMDTTSLEGNGSVSNYAGAVSAVWSSNDGKLTLTFSPDLGTGTHTLALAALVKDRRGSELEQTYSFTFSTEVSLASGAISGTVADDPNSAYDNSLEKAEVVLFDGDPMGGGSVNVLGFVQASSDGSYHFSWLSDGTYYAASGIDSNGDGGLSPETGDSIGIYGSNPVTVSADETTGVDITFQDTEAIIGRVTFDPSTGTLSDDPSGYAPLFYAFVGTDAFSAQMFLTSDPYYTTNDISYDVVKYAVAGTSWNYYLDPFYYSDLSVEGRYFDDSITPTDLTYIPKGQYGILARLGMSTETYLGFAPSPAAIAATGDDAVGKDIVLYLTRSMRGAAEVVSMGSDPALYGSADISLRGWPLMTARSNLAQGSTPTGYYRYDGAPAGFEFSIHIEPDAADKASPRFLMPINYSYHAFGSGDLDNEMNLSILPRDIVNAVADFTGGPGSASVDFGKAQVAGWIEDGLGGQVVGATVTISSGETVYYWTTEGGTDHLTTTGGTRDTNDGPQFLIFNVTPPSSGKGTISAVKTGVTIPTTTVPLRSGEFTFGLVFAE